MGVVKDAIDSGCGQALGHDRVEASRVEVGGDGQAALLIGCVDHAVEGFSGLLTSRQQADVVNRDQVGPADASHHLADRGVDLGPSDGVGQGLQGEPGDPQSGLDGGPTEGLAEVTLAGAAGPTYDQVLGPADPLQGHQGLLSGRGYGGALLTPAL